MAPSRIALVLWLSAFGALAGPADAAAAWGEFSGADRRVTARRAPSPFERREALDEMQAALGRWQKERTDFARDVDQRERWLVQSRATAAGAGAGAAVDEAEVEAVVRSGKVVEVGKPGRAGKAARYGKVIEVGPGEDAQPKSALDEEIGKAAERAEALERRKREDPEGYAREKAQRQAVVEGNRAWDEAVARRFKQREEAIEAEARVMQAELDAARLLEEKAQAKKLGGTLDSQGNFVDNDLGAEEKKQ
ncbi:MAG: hypothetical protein ACYC8T_27525 [Myxococcaceae bacterium]